ncbi:MAG: hypothetical protein A2W25_11760 [candidate division Zixibacteria bacterium RBG_16_53_22]|nr:MAG: hypothetical protein A2W25_11760 [candidate division Zixibacteria bacterium RBG_16_53_22]
MVNKTSVRVLKAIIEYKETHDGNSPSYAAIKGMARVAKATAFQQVLNLVQAGYLRKNGSQIEVVNGAWQYNGEFPQV